MKDRSKALPDLLIRPERPFIPPPRKAPAPESGNLEAAATGFDAVVNGTVPAPPGNPDEPWGPPPEIPQAPVSGPGPKPELIPVLFSLSPESYEELLRDTLKSKARMIRDARLKQAVHALAETQPESDLDSAVIELALLVYPRQLAIVAPADPEEA